MRNVVLFAALLSPMAMAQSLSVEPHSLMRLPGNASAVTLERLDVADYATVLVPGNLSEITIGQLKMGHEARIAIVPNRQELTLRVHDAQLASGSEILARGAPGTFEKAPSPGRNMTLRIDRLSADELVLDARGGSGAPGYAGLDGGYGRPAGCLWGAASRGADGDNGGNGREGGAGALVRLQVPGSLAAEAIKVRVDGGAGGSPGAGGKPGKGGAGKNCLVYQAKSGKAGRAGEPGQPGATGAPGNLILQRL